MPKDRASHSNACPSEPVTCEDTAVEVMCPWRGKRRELTSHLASCPYVKLQPVLSHLLSRLQAVEAKLAASEAKVQDDDKFKGHFLCYKCDLYVLPMSARGATHCSQCGSPVYSKRRCPRPLSPSRRTSSRTHAQADEYRETSACIRTLTTSTGFVRTEATVPLIKPARSFLENEGFSYPPFSISPRINIKNNEFKNLSSRRQDPAGGDGSIFSFPILFVFHLLVVVVVHHHRQPRDNFTAQTR